jgi:CheY-like chemotaxis protein
VTATLLCVDDSKTMRKVLEITFAGENYRTVLAESSEDALGKLRSEKPAVALVDANLGAQSGYDLCQQIKREAPQVGVIILASKQQPFDKARGATVGSDDFIDKPFDTQQLIDKVAAVMRRVAEGARAPAAAAAPVAAAAAPLQPMASVGLGQPAGGGLGARPRANTLAYGSSAAPQPPTNAQQPSVSRVPTFTGTNPPAPAPSLGARPVAAPSPQPPPTAPLGHAPAQKHPAPAATPPAPAAAPLAAPAAALAGDGAFADKLSGLGLTREQIQGVLSLSREVVEQVVWEVVPVLAETLIKEEIKRLTSD